jgi:hypothetical protein
MNHVRFLLFRESPTTPFPAGLWAMYRHVRLQGKALTFDFHHMLGIPELTTIRRRKTIGRWGLEPEMMSGSVEDIVKIFDLYTVHMQRAGDDLTNPNSSSSRCLSTA